MPETLRTTLVEVPSGLIELALVGGVVPVLEFNCSCEDALPYCRALCCRTRTVTNAVLTTEEADRLQSREVSPGLRVLQSNPDDDSCVYLDSQAHLCKIHEKKPVACANWHCSPNGVGEGLVQKDKGWFLSPMGSLLRAL